MTTVRVLTPAPDRRAAEGERLAAAIERRAAARVAEVDLGDPGYWRRVRCVSLAGTVLAEGAGAQEVYTFACELCRENPPVRLERYDAQSRRWVIG